MTLDQINARFVELSKMEEEARISLANTQANLNAIIGAKQDCQYWLNEIGKEVIPAAPEIEIIPPTEGE